MNKVLLIVIVVSLFLSYCQNKKTLREITLKNFRIVGEISKDTIFNGRIKFYDISSNLLKEEANYTFGKLNGDRTLYSPDGKPLSILHYENDKNFGFNLFFDSSGHLINKTYWYYDIRVGPTLDYLNENLIKYNFHNFENEIIYSLNYNDLKEKTLVELKTNFFHFSKVDSVHFVRNHKDVGLKYLIYIINPPKYHFDYAIVVIDSNYNIIQEVYDLDENLPFSYFTILNKPAEGNYNAIRLNIYDSMNIKNDYLMFKKI